MSKNREYRNMTFEVRQDRAEPSFVVDGDAATVVVYRLNEIDGEDHK